MIGGCDLIYEIDMDAEQALNFVCDAARKLWPDCVVEDSEPRKPVVRYAYSFELFGVSEVMIFKTPAFREMWRSKGATPETEDTMIYALASDRELTLAVCNPEHGEVKEIVGAVERRLNEVCHV